MMTFHKVDVWHTHAETAGLDLGDASPSLARPAVATGAYRSSLHLNW